MRNDLLVSNKLYISKSLYWRYTRLWLETSNSIDIRPTALNHDDKGANLVELTPRLKVEAALGDVEIKGVNPWILLVLFCNCNISNSGVLTDWLLSKLLTSINSQWFSCAMSTGFRAAP